MAEQQKPDLESRDLDGAAPALQRLLDQSRRDDRRLASPLHAPGPRRCARAPTGRRV